MAVMNFLQVFSDYRQTSNTEKSLELWPISAKNNPGNATLRKAWILMVPAMVKTLTCNKNRKFDI